MKNTRRKSITRHEPPDIFRAAVNNDVTELKAALDDGQSLSFRHPSKLLMTAVHVAAARKSNDFLQAASDHQTFDPWIRDANGRLPADHAMAYRNREAETLLTKAMYAHLYDGSGGVVDFPSGTPSPEN